MPNNRLERTVKNRGHPVLAMNCVLAREQLRSRPVIQHNR